MFTQRLYHSLGLAAHLGWARLLVDRFRDLAEVPAPTREGPGGGRHHFAPDDEGAFEYGNYQNPATPTKALVLKLSPFTVLSSNFSDLEIIFGVIY